MYCSCWETNPRHDPEHDPQHDHCLNCGLCPRQLTADEEARRVRLPINGKYRWRILEPGDPRIGAFIENGRLTVNVAGRFKRLKANRVLRYLRASTEIPAS